MSFKTIKKYRNLLKDKSYIEEIAGNNSSSGNVAGFTPDTIGVKKRKRKIYGEVFSVPDSIFKEFMEKKKLPENYGEEIKKFSLMVPDISIVLRNEQNGSLIYFRRKPVNGVFTS